MQPHAPMDDMNSKQKTPGEHEDRNAGRGADKNLPFGDSGKPDSEPGPEARLLSLAQAGDAEAQFRLSEMYQSGEEGVPFDFAESTRWVMAAAEQGHPLAQEFLGEVYYEGDGVEQDFEQAAKWFRAAARAGDPDAQFYLGRMYAREEADMEDDPDAEQWLTVAESVCCDANSHIFASLQGFYEDGTLPRPGEPKSFQGMRRAASIGVRMAQYDLGSAYLNGEGVERDEAEAAKWFRKAAMQGCRVSQLALGVIALGGTPMDHARSPG